MILDTLRVWLQTTLQGKLTYTFAVLSIIGSVYGWIEGYISQEIMLQTISTALMALGLRRGLTTYSTKMEQIVSAKKN